MAEGLQIEIGAKVDDLKKGLSDAEKRLDKFEKAATGSAKGSESLGKSTEKSSSKLNNLSNAVSNVSPDIEGLTSSIGELAMGLGAAGLGAAIVLAGTLLLKYSDELSGVSKATKALIAAQKDLIGSAQAEITTYTSLLSIAKDTTKSYDDRKKALDKVNDISGKYIGNLDLESINSKKAADATDGYTNALIRQAKIKGIEARIGDLFAKKFELEAELAEKSTSKVQGALEVLKNSGGGANRVLLGFTDTLSDNQEEVNKTQKSIDNLNTALSNLLKGDIGDEFGIFTDTKDVKLKGSLDKEATGKDIREKLVSILGDLKNALNVDLKAKLFIETGEKQIGAVADSFNLGFDPTTISADLPTLAEPINALIEKQNELLTNSQLVAQGVGDAFNTLGSNISNALVQTQGVFGAFVGTLIQESLKLVGQLIQNSIRSAIAVKATAATQIAANQAVAASNAVVAATSTAAASGPGAAFLLPALIGAALAAVGSAFSGLGGSGGATSNVGGSGSSSGGNNFGTSTSTQSSGFNGGRVVFEIGGDKLIGVLNNTSLGNLRVGDSNQLITTG